MTVRKDLTGQTFGDLYVESFSHRHFKPRGGLVIMYKVRCNCGDVFTVSQSNLKSGNTRRCINCRGERTSILQKSDHQFTNSPTYSSWSQMVNRCVNQKSQDYSTYGGAGIEVCSRWVVKRGGSFENFLEDMGEKPVGTSLNRIHGSLLYSKETCEWATYSVQSYDQKISRDNSSGRTGVYLKKNGKYLATISKDNTRYTLGTFSSYEEAVEAREKAEIQYYGFIKK